MKNHIKTYSQFLNESSIYGRSRYDNYPMVDGMFTDKNGLDLWMWEYTSGLGKNYDINTDMSVDIKQQGFFKNRWDIDQFDKLPVKINSVKDVMVLEGFEYTTLEGIPEEIKKVHNHNRNYV